MPMLRRSQKSKVGFEDKEAKVIDDATLNDAARKASGIVAAAFKSFLNLFRFERYCMVVKRLSKGKAKWSETKRAIEIDEGVGIGHGSITKLLSIIHGCGVHCQRYWMIWYTWATEHWPAQVLVIARYSGISRLANNQP